MVRIRVDVPMSQTHCGIGGLATEINSLNGPQIAYLWVIVGD